MSFPNEFVWGAATAAYQIEGATEADGRPVSTAASARTIAATPASAWRVSTPAAA